jgi:hypothetical protein
MEIKKEIEKLLFDLNTEGWGRDEIESEFDYKDNYISQALSRGGNKKLLSNLKKLYSRLQKEKIKPSLPGDIHNRERAMLKVLMDEMSILMATVSELKNEKPVVSQKSALKELKERTSQVLDNLDFED